MSDQSSDVKGSDFEPYIPATRTLPEITVKAVLLGAGLSVVLAGANAYLGLKVGLTVSASIPAAVLSMAILRAFRESNILENNIVQTAASAGESLAAGVIFTLPALILLGYWNDFRFLPTAAIALCGGILGVFFSVPLRRALIIEADLRFPEGVATGEVLKAGTERGGGARRIAVGALAAAGLTLVQKGLGLAGEAAARSVAVGGAVFGFGMNLSPALLGVGFIVGPRVAIPLLAGGAITVLVGVPLYMTMIGPEGVSEVDEVLREELRRLQALQAEMGEPVTSREVTVADVASRIWGDTVRFLGVGAMFVGGLWALLSVARYVRAGIRASLAAVTRARSADRGQETAPRTERDLPIHVVFRGSLLLAIPILAVYLLAVDRSALGVSGVLHWSALGVAVLFSLAAGFVFSAVAGYMAGLVGSSNNPVSGVTVITVLLAAFGLYGLFALEIGFGMSEGQALAGAAAAVLVGAVVACAAAISGDNLQDLKAGHLVGATPERQQMMQILGVVATALVIGPILSLLYTAYGLGDRLPRPTTMDPLVTLDAPQAQLMRQVAAGVFSGDLPWTMIAIGAVIAVAVIVLDQLLQARGASVRVPVMAVAVGMYLSLGLGVTIFAGGLVAWLAARALRRDAAGAGLTEAEVVEVGKRSSRQGLLLTSGLITGEALMGIVLAIPFAVTQDQKAFHYAPASFGPVATAIGIAAVLGIALWIYRTAASREAA